MAKVAREMVEKAGVDVDKLVDLLVKNASAELTTYYYYTILRAMSRRLLKFNGGSVDDYATLSTPTLSPSC